jgi:hypothetical protein
MRVSLSGTRESQPKARIWSNNAWPWGKAVVSEFLKKKLAELNETVESWVGYSIICDQVMS